MSNNNPKTPSSTPSAPKQSAGEITGIVLGVICLVCLIVLTVGSTMNLPFGWIIVLPIIQCICQLFGGRIESMSGGKKSRFEKFGE